MRFGKAILFGVLGAMAISLLSALLRAFGVALSIEHLLGVLVGLDGAAAFEVGLLMHVAMGGLWGLLYGYLFERVWKHGGASTGVLLSVIHASLIGILIGFTPLTRSLLPGQLEPGPFFANLGIVGVLGFFTSHLVFGAIVGAGYGHVASEREWAPTGRL